MRPKYALGHGVSLRVDKFFKRSFPSIHNCCAVVCVGMCSRSGSRAMRFLRESRLECKTSISVTSNRRCHPRSTCLILPSFFLYTKLIRKGRRERRKRGGNIYAGALICTYRYIHIVSTMITGHSDHLAVLQS